MNNVKEALDMCQKFVDNNATINVIEDKTGVGGISFTAYTADPIQTLIDNYKILAASDMSKEKSSMKYYNDTKELRGELREYQKLFQEAVKYIAQHSDCPLENEGVDIDCEYNCAGRTDRTYACWVDYFKKKVAGEI